MKKTVSIVILVFGILLAWTSAFADFYVIPVAGKRARRTILVSPERTAAESGTALLSALNGITDNSSTNPYLIKIEPGIYDTGSKSIQMKSYVDIEGSGEETTWILGKVDSSTTGVIKGSSESEIRFLSVVNDGDGSYYAIAICNEGASMRITHVRAIARNANNNWAIQNHSGSNALLTHVTAEALGNLNSSAVSEGVRNVNSTPTMIQVVARAGGAAWSYAVSNEDGSSTKMVDVATTASGGSTYNVGVFNSNSSPTLIRVTADAMGGGASHSAGIYNAGSSLTILGAKISVSTTGGGTHSGIDNYDGPGEILIRDSLIESVGYGIHCHPTARVKGITVRVVHCHVQGSYKSLANEDHSWMRVGSCLLEGGIEETGGTLSCYGNFDEYMNPVTCP